MFAGLKLGGRRHSEERLGLLFLLFAKRNYLEENEHLIFTIEPFPLLKPRVLLAALGPYQGPVLLSHLEPPVGDSRTR
jgi:hypothetical protein